MSLMALTTIPAILLPEQCERDMRFGQFLVDFLAVWHCEGRVSLFPVDWKQFVLDVLVCHLGRHFPSQTVDLTAPGHICYRVPGNTACQCGISLAEPLRKNTQDFLVVCHFKTSRE